MTAYACTLNSILQRENNKDSEYTQVLHMHFVNSEIQTGT